MAEVKMYLMIFALVLAFLFHVIGFATPNWSKGAYLGQMFHRGLWEECLSGACNKLDVDQYKFMAFIRILECVALFFFFFAPVIAGYLTYHANKERNVTRGWKRTSAEPFGNAIVVITALIFYVIVQDGTLDYSFFLTCVSALLSVIAGILGLSVKFPQNGAQNGIHNPAMIATATPIVIHQGNNPQMAPQAAYPPQFNQGTYPSYGMAPAMYGQQFNQGNMNQGYAIGPQFNQGNSTSGHGMAPAFDPQFNSVFGNETAPPPYKEP